MLVEAVPKLASAARFRDIDKEMSFETFYESLQGTAGENVRQTTNVRFWYIVARAF